MGLRHPTHQLLPGACTSRWCRFRVNAWLYATLTRIYFYELWLRIRSLFVRPTDNAARRAAIEALRQKNGSVVERMIDRM